MIPSKIQANRVVIQTTKGREVDNKDRTAGIEMIKTIHRRVIRARLQTVGSAILYKEKTFLRNTFL